MTGTLAPIRYLNRREQVLALWCSLTGHEPSRFDEPEREALLARTEIAALAEVPDSVLLDAGQAVRRGTSLPLERWLAAVRVVRPHQRVS
ncbi:hypothetical protein [Cryptosporangium phraense]|uniref:Uncharacterized protein n=1 Tax=Cryptosporangium phraense TaxID=2593070 RepID=A0A545ATC4_9ACTN|nr:hypothetical protein [Cryptosporangium phraense]TQS44584.1 hypothetical protein FL583_14120 [Cryptosporangium phraense]